MSELLTMEEIEAEYDGQWVVLVDIESDPGPVLRKARVVWHGTDHDEAWAKAAEVESRHIGVLYIGEWSAEDEPIPML